MTVSATKIKPYFYTVVTESGSLYFLREEGGKWWLCAKNVPNERSKLLGTVSWWEIEKPNPWPPRRGHSLGMWSTLFLEPVNTPNRMPGGGKVTSRVARWYETSTPSSEEPIS